MDRPPDAAVRQALMEGRPRILNHLLRRLGDRDMAEDVLHDFARRALEHSSELRDARAVHGWLRTVLASCVADARRRAARQRRRDLPASQAMLEAVAVAPEQEPEPAVCGCAVALLPALRSADADLIRRIDLHAEPRAVTARRLGIGADHLAVRLHRARQALRRMLERTCLACPEHGFFDCLCAEAARATGR